VEIPVRPEFDKTIIEYFKYIFSTGLVDIKEMLSGLCKNT